MPKHFVNQGAILMHRVFILLILATISTQAAPFVSAQDDDAVDLNLGKAENEIPLDPQFRFELEEAIKKKDFERAEQMIVNEISGNPNAPQRELLAFLGGLFFMDQKYLNSAVAFKKAEAISPLTAGNRFTLSMAYILLGRSDWARPELERLIEENPSSALYPYWIARIDYDNNEYASAVERLSKIVASHPTFVRAYDRLGLCYEALGQTELAIANYKRAIELNATAPKPSPWPSLNLGSLLIQSGELSDAELHLRDSVRIDPTFAQGHYKLGLVLEKLEQLEESATELRRAAELDPAFPDPHWALARVLRRAGDKEGAQGAVQKYQELKKLQKEKDQG